MVEYKLSDYDYHLPIELIAQEPLAERDKSRMMILEKKTGKIINSIFNRIPTYLKQGDLLVLNDTKVLPVRLLGRIPGKDTAVEILLLHRCGDERWIAMVRPGRKLKPGVKVSLEEGVTALIEDYADKGLREISFSVREPIEKLLPRLGRVPLPPYIKKELSDPDQYQTIFAAREGSAAAPTAGFHFTDRVFAELDQKGVEKAFITLHIGPGTFQPVKEDDIREHVMHREYYQLHKSTVNALNAARERGGRIVAVGTSVCRVLETVAESNGYFAGEVDGWTDLYIYPGYKFRAVNTLLTNFHLPRSTLLMLVSAFAERKNILHAYREAVVGQYRFFSFGDCMLII